MDDSSDEPGAVNARARELLAKELAEGADEQSATDSLVEAVKEAGRTLADRLRERLPSLIVAETRTREGFEAALFEVWRRAFDLYVAVYRASAEFGEEVGKKLARHSDEGVRVKGEALRLLHARACLVASEMFGLLRTGHPLGARARWRTAHEIAVVSMFLADADAATAKRFLDHRAVLAARDAQEFQEHAESLGYQPLGDDEMGTILQWRDEVVARHGDEIKSDYGWAASALGLARPRFADLSRKVALQHANPMWRLATRHVHADSKAAALGEVEFRGERSLLAGPMNAQLSEPGQSALISLQQTNAAVAAIALRDLADSDAFVRLEAIRILVDDARQAFSEGEEFITELEANVTMQTGEGEQ